MDCASRLNGSFAPQFERFFPARRVAGSGHSKEGAVMGTLRVRLSPIARELTGRASEAFAKCGAESARGLVAYVVGNPV
jgi:hypothetical protein